MEFIEEIRMLGSRSRKLAEVITNEEGTKTALILPFVQLLGYDIFNPLEVVPEFQAEAGVKKDQRVDYALLKDDQPVILIECKAYAETLNAEHADQLKRYFPFVPSAKIGVLTNGHHYKFFTDLEQDNVMDDMPYMEFDIEDPSMDLLPKLQELRKERFDDEKAVQIAEQLKYTGQFKRLLANQLESPEEDFVRFFAKKVWSGQINQSVRDKLTPLLKEAFKQFIEDRIAARFKKAAQDEETQQVQIEADSSEEEAVEEVDDGIVTTEDEILGHQIIQAIAARNIDPERVVMRDNRSYCAILLDDNNRKTIVRLFFTKNSLRFEWMGVKRGEPSVSLETVSDLYKYGDGIREVIAGYDKAE